MTTRHRLSLGLLFFAAAPFTFAADCTEKAAWPSSGTSIVGSGKVHPKLVVETSGGNDVVALRSGGNPVAFGGGDQNVVNSCLSPDGGFADVGSGDYSFATKKHAYAFTFVSGATASQFSVRMVDWGDYLPYGACPGGVCRFTLTAWDAQNRSIATDSIAFSSTSTAKIGRPSDEFGSLANSGDACDASAGQPGHYIFRVSGSGIAKVTLAAADRAALDPHIAFDGLCFTLEKTTIDVTVDVKPGEAPNRINPKSKGTTPVAILSTAAFDAADVLVSTVVLAGEKVETKGGRPQASMEDVDGDGRADLLMHFDTPSISGSGTVLELTGRTKDGSGIAGKDTIEFVN
jgi:hypothetical protein